MADLDILFVVGAGASKEVELPTGKELTYQIGGELKFGFDSGRLVSGNPEIAEAILKHSGGRHNARSNQLFTAGRVIAAALPHAPSIDTYLDDRNDDDIRFVGKLAIIDAILEAERRSRLSTQNRPGATVDMLILRADPESC